MFVSGESKQKLLRKFSEFFLFQPLGVDFVFPLSQEQQQQEEEQPPPNFYQKGRAYVSGSSGNLSNF